MASLAFCILVGLTGCNGNKTGTESEATEPTLAETNAGVDAATDGDDASALEATESADAVKVLSDDNVYRPGMKVDCLTILDFNATWCGPCKQFAPAFHEAAEKFGDKVTFVSIDVDVNPETAASFGIEAIPTVIFLYPNGKTRKYVGTEDLLPVSRFVSLVHGEM